jgi:signal transduction histidine kinase
VGLGFSPEALAALRQAHFDLGEAQSLVGWVLTHRAVLNAPDVLADPRYVSIDPEIRSGLWVPVAHEAQLHGVLAVLSARPRAFAQPAERLLTLFANQVALAEEIRQLNAELRRRVAARTRELSALYEVSAVSSEAAALDQQWMLSKSLALALKVVGSQGGAIHLRGETSLALHLVTEQGNVPAATSGLAEWVLDHGEPLVVPDLLHDARVAQVDDASSQRTYVGLPMRVRGQVLGVLSVFGNNAHQFNVEEVALLAATADQMAVAVENVRLRQRAEQAAVMEERARLARELHDSVTQLLYSLMLFAEAGRELAETDNAQRVQSHLGQIGETAQQALKEMRLLVYELRPPVLEREGLASALQRRLEAVEQRSGMRASLEIGAMQALHVSVEEALYLIAQEALNNALKHAEATAVQVQLRQVDQQVELTIIDDGVGFDPEAPGSSGGLGLTSMRQRAEKLGGTLTLVSAPGQGTQVKVVVPRAQSFRVAKASAPTPNLAPDRGGREKSPQKQG